MKRAGAHIHRVIAQLHRELADAYERLADSEAPQDKPAKVAPAPATTPPQTVIDSTRRALRKKGIAA